MYYVSGLPGNVRLNSTRELIASETLYPSWSDICVLLLYKRAVVSNRINAA